MGSANDDLVSTVVAGAILWVLAVVAVAFGLDAFAVVPADVPIPVTAALLFLGGVLLAFVGLFLQFFSQRQARLFL